MKILSFDVGMKNLAYCMVEIQDCSKNYIIQDWGVIDLTNNSNYICSYELKNKKKKGSNIIKICGNKAKYMKYSNYFCNVHSNKSEYKKPTQTLNINKIEKIKKMSLKKIKKLMEDHDIQHDGKKKEECLELIITELNTKYLEPIETKNANSIDLVDFGINLKYKLLGSFKNKKIDLVLIENQIGPIALRMKTLQGMITQHFIERGIYNIKTVNSINKLKHFSKEKMTYSQRKKKSIDVTKDIILSEKNKNTWCPFFNKSKKKDDLADCFLQCRWYIIEKKLLINHI